MISLNRLVLVALLLAHLGCFIGSVNAFVAMPKSQVPGVTPSIQHHHHYAEPRSETELSASSRRREIFGKLKKVFFASGVASVFQSNEPAFAEDATPSPITGRVVQLEIGNVGGVEGKTGSIKIQLHPEWAPKGVQRFEQLTEEKFWDGCRYATMVYFYF